MNSFKSTDLCMQDVINKAQPVLNNNKQELKVIDVKRAATAAACLQKFSRTIKTFTDNAPFPISAVSVAAVGSKMGPDRRSGLYDLWWFPAEADTIYACCVKDPNTVFKT